MISHWCFDHLPLVWKVTEKEVTMVRKLFTLFCASVISFSLTTVLSGQETAAPEKKMDKAAKEVRWEGNVIRSDQGQSTLTIRQVGSNAEMTAHYDSSTRWVSQYHGDKKVNDIDASQVKDGDRVIVMGNYEKHVLHATLISKRLSHSQ